MDASTYFHNFLSLFCLYTFKHIPLSRYVYICFVCSEENLSDVNSPTSLQINHHVKSISLVSILHI